MPMINEMLDRVSELKGNTWLWLSNAHRISPVVIGGRIHRMVDEADQIVSSTKRGVDRMPSDLGGVDAKQMLMVFARNSTMQRSPEVALWLAVLGTVCEDIVSFSIGKENEQRYAAEFIWSPGFDSIVACCGLDRDFVRENLIRWSEAVKARAVRGRKPHRGRASAAAMMAP